MPRHRGTAPNRRRLSPGHKPPELPSTSSSSEDAAVPSPAWHGDTQAATASLGPPVSHGGAPGSTGAAQSRHPRVSLPRGGLVALLGDELQEQGSARHRPAERARSPQPPRAAQPAPGCRAAWRAHGHGGTSPEEGSAQSSRGTSPAARERGFAQLLLFLKKRPQKASVLPVTRQCHTRPFQINPRGQKTFSR